MIEIPSWLFGVAPSAENLGALRTAGLIPDAVKTYVSPEAYASQTGYTVKEGPPKWWSNPSVNPGVAYAQFDGTTHVASEMSAFENALYSQSVRMFYAERPDLWVPTLVHSGSKTPYELRRLSFEEGLEDPAEFPLGIIWEDRLANQFDHSFPSDIVLFMLNGRPMAAKLDEALALFPLTPRMPVGPGATVSYSAGDLVALATRMNSGTSARVAAKAILDGQGDDAAKAAALAKL